MNQTLHQTLHRQLVQLRERHAAWLDGEQPDGLNLKGGICMNVNLSPQEIVILCDLMDQWPDGSGVPGYPVPAPMEGRTAGEHYYYADPLQKWHPQFEYARNRLTLLDWLIEQTAPTNRKENSIVSQTLHQQLLEVRGRARAWLAEKSGHGLMPSFGICSQISLSVVDEDLLGDLCAEWPSGSGDRDYPVPHPDCDPDAGYTRARPQEMWNPQFEYARNRLALLDWLIEQTKPTEELQP